MKSVAEEDALRKLLTSDEDSDEEKKTDDSDKEEDEAKNKKDAKDAKEAKESRDKKRKKLKKKAKDEKKDKKDSSSDISSNSSDSEAEQKSKKQKNSVASHSRSASPSITLANPAEPTKRKMTSMPTDLGISENSNSPTTTPAKRVKMEQPTALPASISNVVNSVNSKEYDNI